MAGKMAYEDEGRAVDGLPRFCQPAKTGMILSNSAGSHEKLLHIIYAVIFHEDLVNLVTVILTIKNVNGHSYSINWAVW